MIEEELNEPCYVDDWESTHIKTEFEIFGKMIEVEQRRLSVSEVENHRINIQSAYKDPVIYKSLLKEDEIEKKIEKAKKQLEQKMKKSAKILTDDELEAELRTTIDVDDETKYLLYEAKLNISENNKLVNTKFVMYSTSPSDLYGGYFKLDGKQLSPIKTISILKELDKEDFMKLYRNAEKLSYPTKKEQDEVK